MQQLNVYDGICNQSGVNKNEAAKPIVCAGAAIFLYREVLLGVLLGLTLGVLQEAIRGDSEAGYES